MFSFRYGDLGLRIPHKDGKSVSAVPDLQFQVSSNPCFIDLMGVVEASVSIVYSQCFIGQILAIY